MQVRRLEEWHISNTAAWDTSFRSMVHNSVCTLNHCTKTMHHQVSISNH